MSVVKIHWGICPWRNKLPSFYRLDNLYYFEVNEQVNPPGRLTLITTCICC
jgi:hypothetical protein